LLKKRGEKGGGGESHYLLFERVPISRMKIVKKKAAAQRANQKCKKKRVSLRGGRKDRSQAIRKEICRKGRDQTNQGGFFQEQGDDEAISTGEEGGELVH